MGQSRIASGKHTENLEDHHFSWFKLSRQEAPNSVGGGQKAKGYETIGDDDDDDDDDEDTHMRAHK